jgi:hypothetical protein
VLTLVLVPVIYSAVVLDLKWIKWDHARISDDELRRTPPATPAR